MIDLPVTYLFFAGLDSWDEKRFGLAGFEWGAWLSSRSFMPAQALAVLSIVALFAFVGARRLSWTAIPWPRWTWWVGLAAALLVMAGPFAWRSYQVAGTPMFPLWVGSDRPAILHEAARESRQGAEAYGEGRSIGAFVRHFWRIAIPAQGVNNAFDYPLGLPYWLCLAPFLWIAARQWRSGAFSREVLLAIAFYAVWWSVSQQSRWLYVPVILIFLAALNEDWVRDSPLFRGGLALGLGFALLSTARAHQARLRTIDPEALIRPQDKALRAACAPIGNIPLEWTNREIAYADCQVHIKEGPKGWVLP